jgi:hypothetical protein
MESVIVRLRGWADSISLKRNKKIEFPIQMAIYEVIGDCDWELDIHTEGSDVRKQFKIKVVAERVCASNGGERTIERTFQRLEFEYIVLSYTMFNVYQGAVNALSKVGGEMREYKYLCPKCKKEIGGKDIMSMSHWTGEEWGKCMPCGYEGKAEEFKKVNTTKPVE